VARIPSTTDSLSGIKHIFQSDVTRLGLRNDRAHTGGEIVISSRLKEKYAEHFGQLTSLAPL
jgi:hypothetical protein